MQCLKSRLSSPGSKFSITSGAVCWASRQPSPIGVFIAYGRRDDWRALKVLLEGWGLEVEHFNRERPEGLMVAERWRQMLDRSRFAFAVMTPDDKLAD